MATSTPSDPGGKSEGLVRTTVNGGPSVFYRICGSELSLTLRPQAGESVTEFFGRMARALEGVTVLDMLLFGSTRSAVPAMASLRRIFGAVDWPVTWVDGGAVDDRVLAGVQVSGLAGGAVERIRLNGSAVGSVFNYGGARHCLLGGLGPVPRFSTRSDQTKQTFEKLEAALAEAKFSIADVVRTWFYLEDMLSWYGVFNRVRTQFYSGVRFRANSLPASTGVGAHNAAGAALALAARAMQPLDASAQASEVISPLQGPAPAYGSSFSRAMELSTAAGRRLFISGTASIAPGGETLWQEDVTRQVEQTMQVVEALLRSRGFGLGDVTRAVAYFKHRAFAPVFVDWCEKRGLSSLPVVLTHCDICRDDLGFELEADAGKSV